MKHLFPLLLILFAFGSASESLIAQTTSTQDYTVTIPSVLTFTPPNSLETVNHDQTNNNLSFGAQTWTLAANGANGAIATFSTTQPFVHETESTSRRDVQLGLAIGSSDSGSGWAVDTATDTTDYANSTPDNSAVVTASSTGPGAADLNLTVTFVTGQFSTLVVGDYTVTVTGTLTVNP